MGDLDRAVAAIHDGELVVYPTETVYGLGADALTPATIERVFEAKRRPRDRPLSLGVPDVETALEYVRVTEFERAFMQAFLPGPVTVVVEKAAAIPDILTGGRDRVGIRVPDHEVAKALLERAEPITATSANVSGQGSVTHLSELDATLREAVAVVLDAGRTPGVESTVVDPGRRIVHRRGACGDAVEAWLEERSE